jgi:hypothetical protein
MSEPDRRYDSPSEEPHGSSAYTGQPLSDQPTEVVDTVGYVPRHDTAAVTTPITHPAARSADREPTAWLPDEEPPLPLGEWDEDATQPDYRDAPVEVRRADTLAGLLLLLAGIAAGVSLLVVWVHGGDTGAGLVSSGFDDLRTPQQLVDRDTWAPATVVLGGAVLFVLGLFMYIPAKTHRLLGVLALLVSLAVAAAVLVPLADANWDVGQWAVGGWFTVAVAGLGFLGALKALMTHPKRR